ncbi:hypothetical protein HYFRA_00011720 [Hymenoscyphus fraxineus]|uniref:Uncharacterized protein n=1 Tax=Hymenoscyphus fraxineus TaxID=746836 RepID=A0A9N9PU43_9HELO|nr:hypothetical protein HYFRA_00011720 [Hymenoscyphus fraxineus]
MGSDDFQVRRGRTQRRAIIGVDRREDDRRPSKDRVETVTRSPQPTPAPAANPGTPEQVTIPIESALQLSTTTGASPASNTSPPGNLIGPDTSSGLQPPSDRVKSSGPSPLALLGIGITLASLMVFAIVIYFLRRCGSRRDGRARSGRKPSCARSARQSIWGGSTSAPSPRNSFQYNVYTSPMAEKVPTVADTLSQAESGIKRPVTLLNREDPYSYDVKYNVPSPKAFTRPSSPNKIVTAKSNPSWGKPQFPPMTYQKPENQGPVMPLNADGFRMLSASSRGRYIKQTPTFRALNQYSFNAQNTSPQTASDLVVGPKEQANLEYDGVDYASTIGDGWTNPAHNSVGFAPNLSAPTPNNNAYNPSQFGKIPKSPTPAVVTESSHEEDIIIPGTLPRWTDPLTWAQDQTRRNATRTGEGRQGGIGGSFG